MIRNSLYIFNSKGAKAVCRVGSVLLVLLAFSGIIRTLNYMYVQEEDWQHILWHSFYTEENNIDNIFIGSSHVYFGVDPFLLDEINGMNNFNMSSGSLTLSSSYAMLLEADRYNDLSNVFLELYYAPNTGNTGDANTIETIMNNWRTTTYMKPSWNKYIFIFSMSGSEHYMESLFPFIRYRAHLFDTAFIQGVIDKKKSENWKNYIYDDGTDEYLEKGFKRTTTTMKLGLVETRVDLSSEKLLSETNCEYLARIIEYCQNRDINIELFVSPIYATQILSSRDYDAYHRQVLNIAQKYNVPFYDFNLCKSEYLDIMHTELYRDYEHLNTNGADMFTPFLWNVLTNKCEDNKDFFCNTYEDKISLDLPELYGVFYENGEGCKNLTVASNTATELEYRIIFTPIEGEQEMIQDFSINKEFTLTNDIGNGTITVVARSVNDTKNVQTLEIPY